MDQRSPSRDGINGATAEHDGSREAMESEHVATGDSSPAATAAASSRYLLGLVLLAVVVCLWVASSTLIQQIFVDLEFRSPFFLTYYSTSLFAIYLPVHAGRRWVAAQCRRRGPWRGSDERSRLRRDRILLQDDLPSDDAIHTGDEAAHTDADASSTSTTPESTAPSTPLTSSCTTPRRVEVQVTDATETSQPAQKMSLRETARLSLYLCPLWFAMNYFFNLSLNLTSVASATILSTTSSLFVLLFSYFLDATVRVRLQQIGGVAITILGVVLISMKDTGGGKEAESARTPRPLLGDLLAIVGAACYGLYTIQLKLRIPDDSLIEMELLFGFLGLFNALVFWPGFFILSATGIESWMAPPSNVLLFLTVNGLFGTVISDFLWAKSVLLTSPLIASLALSLTIPLAIFVDWLLHDLQLTPMYFVGGFCVVLGFILVNVVRVRELKEEVAAATHHSLDSAPAASTPLEVSLSTFQSEHGRDMHEIALDTFAEHDAQSLYDASATSSEEASRASREQDDPEDELEDDLRSHGQNYAPVPAAYS